MLVHIDDPRHETSYLYEKTNSIYIVFTSCKLVKRYYFSSAVPRQHKKNKKNKKITNS